MQPLSVGHRFQAFAARALLSLPNSLQVMLAGGKPVERDGYVLDPQVQHMLAMQRRMRRPHFHQLSVEQARREMEVNTTLLAPLAPVMQYVREDRFPGPGGPIPVRIYRPLELSAKAPTTLYFHGGGFVVGGLDSHDPVCRIVAHEARCVVVAVDYRLAPEHRFPAAADDAVAAFRHVAANADALGIDARRIAVAGDSAGGNLSAVVSLDTRGDAVRPAFQLLIYPAVDLTMSFPSITSLGKGFFLEKKSLEWFMGHYLRSPEDGRDPRASPWFAEVAGAPPAAVFTAGFDPLRDEGEAYAGKLEAAGVPVTYTCHRSMFHGHISASGGLSNARPALSEMAAALRVALS
ncbi:alpha/beta hydrolase [Nannocystis radixulma]|uniref:Alpha/beta hydrolase n=1 Tax=Nannocystis radixulma TaxID=2995305 RepID=A0ABT5BPN3_9BACT|nr:alpha/beta hydrolase [Nannocystis radixulma]MDC0675535.1 alpha/beta hydrolase [Nannocystis radixulma]